MKDRGIKELKVYQRREEAVKFVRWGRGSVARMLSIVLLTIVLSLELTLRRTLPLHWTDIARKLEMISVTCTNP